MTLDQILQTASHYMANGLDCWPDGRERRIRQHSRYGTIIWATGTWWVICEKPYPLP